MNSGICRCRSPSMAPSLAYARRVTCRDPSASAPCGREGFPPPARRRSRDSAAPSSTFGASAGGTFARTHDGARSVQPPGQPHDRFGDAGPARDDVNRVLLGTGAARHLDDRRNPRVQPVGEHPVARHPRRTPDGHPQPRRHVPEDLGAVPAPMYVAAWHVPVDVISPSGTGSHDVSLTSLQDWRDVPACSRPSAPGPTRRPSTPRPAC